MDRSQRPVWVLGSVLLVGLVIGVTVMSSRPQMSMLFGGLSPADQGMVVDELAKAGIKSEADTGGNVFVPASRLAEARMKLATAKRLPNSGNMGVASLDSGMIPSPNVEKEKIKAMKESELASSIQTISGVASARVHLSLGEDTPFMREAKPASASVVINEDGTQMITGEQAQAIARLVQFGVDGLRPENISIINDKGQILYDGGQNGTASSYSDQRIAMETEESHRRQRELQQQLDAAFGVGNTIVSIPVLRLNYDKVQIHSIERDPTAKPVEETTAKETMADTGNSVSGPAGAETNAQPPSETSTNNRNYKGDQKSATYGVNETERTTEKAPGFLEAMAINVLVNKTVVADATPVQQYVQNYLAPYATDPANFSASVVSTAFDTAAKKKADDETAAASGRARNQQFLSMAPIAALVFVAFMLMKAIGKTTKNLGNNPNLALAGGGSLALGDGFASMSRSDLEDIAGLPAGEIQGALERIPSPTEDDVDLIPDKINVPLAQLKQMAKHKPESIANLIKTTLLEDRK